VLNVTVSDTGPGIPEEIAEQLFQPFVTTKAGGMGIGLSISRRIIESHGGELSVSRNEAGGATFDFTLPTLIEETNE
jgi:two-component system sensor kinase FixL